MKDLEMINVKQALMRQTAHFLFVVICIFSISSCKAQDKENPETLGPDNFDLLKLSKDKDLVSLFKKRSYYKTSINNDDNRVIAYNYIISKKRNPVVRVSIGTMDVSGYNYIFKVSNDGKLIGVSISIISKKEVKKSIIENINRQFGKYWVEINQVHDHPSIYRWEAPDRNIQLSYAAFEGDHVYSISIISTKFDCSHFPLEKIFVGEDICQRNYKLK